MSETLKEVAKDLFLELVERTSGPQDAAEVLLYLHILVWTAQGEKVSSAEGMLSAFRAAFLESIGEGTSLQ